jgi:hypothetical protein
MLFSSLEDTISAYLIQTPKGLNTDRLFAPDIIRRKKEGRIIKYSLTTPAGVEL